MKRLLDCISYRLSKENWGLYQSRLKGGKMGLCLFLALYSELTQNSKVRSVAVSVLNEACRSVRSLPCSLLYGNMGIIWGIKYLSRKGILEENGEIFNLYTYVMNEYMRCFSSMPVQIVKDDRLFSGGIFMFQQWNEEDSLERYSLDEKLIGMVDECERQLKLTIKNIHEPNKMSLSMIHSILFFLLKMDEVDIYPYKTKHLIEYVPKVYCALDKNSFSDDYIYHVLMDDDVKKMDFNGLDNDALFRFVGEVGFYSLLYNIPNIFNLALNQVMEIYPSYIETLEGMLKKESKDIDSLCGWGYGLLHYKSEML